jgi:hypothetical protein
MDQSNLGSGNREFNPMRGKVGAIYAQNTKAFIGEYETYFWVTLANDLKPIATIIEAEVLILTGIATAMTGTYWFYVGFTASDFLAKNAHNFKHWIAIIDALLDARKDLKRIAPTLYDNLIDAVLLHYVKSVSATNVAALVGRILGKLGEAALEGRFSIVKMAVTLLGSTIILMLKSIPTAIDEAKAHWNKGIRQLEGKLRGLGVEITDRERIAMFIEITKHTKELKQIADRLTKVFREHNVN